MKTVILTILVQNVLHALMISLGFLVHGQLSAVKLSVHFPLMINSGCSQGRFAGGAWQWLELPIAVVVAGSGCDRVSEDL